MSLCDNLLICGKFSWVCIPQFGECGDGMNTTLTLIIILVIVVFRGNCTGDKLITGNNDYRCLPTLTQSHCPCHARTIIPLKHYGVNMQYYV